MTDHLPNCYRNQTMGHYGGGPADCDCGAARRAMVKPASMTDAEQKVLERKVSELWVAHIQQKSPFEGHAAIVRAISEAVAEERKLNGEARQALADAAREIPMAGPVAERIQALKAEHRQNLQAETERAGDWHRQADRLTAGLKAERDRAGKLVEAVKALIEAAHGLNSAVCQEFCLSSDTSHQPGNTCAPKEIAGAEAAVKEYEVPHE